MNNTAFDFDSLDAAIIKPVNSKKIIVEHLKNWGPPTITMELPLITPNGTIIQDTFENYLTNNKFYSTGAFAKLANGTPLDFQYDTTDGVKQELEQYKDRTAFDLGRFVHQAILEPDQWGKVVCEPNFSRASHEGCDGLLTFWSSVLRERGVIHVDDLAGAKVDTKKEAIKEMILQSGCTSVDNKAYTIVQKLHERWSAYENGLWAKILDKAIREVSMYANDFMGLPIRVRPDGLLFEGQIGVNAVVSVKTTSAPSIDLFKRQYMNYLYNIKEAAYQKVVSHVTGLEFKTTIMIVLQTVEPFATGVFILSDNDMDLSMLRFSASVAIVKECIENNSWPGWEVNSEPETFGIIDLTIYS